MLRKLVAGWGRAVPAMAVVLALLAAPAAATEDVTVEGETLTPSGPAGARADPRASGGGAVELSGFGAADGIVTTARTTVHLFVRARATDCAGPPAIAVRVDGVERLVAAVNSGDYGETGGRLSLPAGSHALSVSLAEGSESGLGGPFCERRAWVDRLTLVAQPFSPTGWRNGRLAKDAALAPNSAALVAELRSQIRNRPRGAYVGTSQYTSPIYVVPPGQPTVRVAAPPGAPHLQAQWNAVPLPPDARPAAGTDQNLSVWQPSTDTLWDFWGLTRDVLGAWRARYGGRMPNVSRNEGHFVDPPGSQYGATATSIALMAGLQRIEELRRGVIDHAISLAVIGTRARDGWCWPAQRTDPQQSSRAKNAIPAGARFRLPARFDLRAYARKRPLSRYALTVARAVQRHGMIASDTSTEVGFAGEDPTPLGWDPYPEIFEGRSPDGEGALANFPWHRLQALAPPPGKRCVDDPDRDG